MEEFILIIISLILGFWQGLRKRNKKNNIKTEEYKVKIATLEDEIKTLNRKLRLQQYNNGSLKKKNKERFETDLTSFITMSMDYYYLCASVYCLLNIVFRTNTKMDRTYYEQEFNVEQISIDIENYLDESELNETNVDLIVEYQKGIKKIINPYDAFACYKEWINSFNIDIYSISLKELMETMYFILYELNLNE